jgi:hypothetical protein
VDVKIFSKNPYQFLYFLYNICERQRNLGFGKEIPSVENFWKIQRLDFLIFVNSVSGAPFEFCQCQYKIVDTGNNKPGAQIKMADFLTFSDLQFGS